MFSCDRRRKMKQQREHLNNNNENEKKVSDKMHVKEWLHENARRAVKVSTIRLPTTKRTLH